MDYRVPSNRRMSRGYVTNRRNMANWRTVKTADWGGHRGGVHRGTNRSTDMLRCCEKG